MDEQRLDRIRGSLVGFALGDALGAPYEFQRKPGFSVPALFYAGAFGTRPGQGTDDSAMARAAAEAILLLSDGNSLTIEYMDNLLRWYETGPADIGNQTLSAVLAWKRDASSPPEGTKGGEGNGGLFTAHVCAARYSGGGIASAFASMTHPASRVRATASALSQHVHHALMHGVFMRGFRELCVPLERPWDTNIGHAPVTYTIAYRAAEMTGKDPEAALPILLHTIALGGDTDSNAAVTGGLLGAIHGMKAWEKFPDLDKLEELDYWLDVAEKINGNT